jgi:hypothetical protein
MSTATPQGAVHLADAATESMIHFAAHTLACAAVAVKVQRGAEWAAIASPVEWTQAVWDAAAALLAGRGGDLTNAAGSVVIPQAAVGATRSALREMQDAQLVRVLVKSQRVPIPTTQGWTLLARCLGPHLLAAPTPAGEGEPGQHRATLLRYLGTYLDQAAAVAADTQHGLTAGSQPGPDGPAHLPASG